MTRPVIAIVSTFMAATAMAEPLDLAKGIFGAETERQFGRWTLRHEGIEGGTVFALAFQPGNGNLLFAGTGLGVFRSEDGGSSWSASRGGLLIQSGGSGFAFDPVDPSLMYLGTRRGPYASRDSGRNWFPINRGIEFIGVDQMVVDPQDGSHLLGTVVASGAPILIESTDGGDTWTFPDPDLGGPAGGASALAFDPNNSRVLYLGVNDFNNGDIEGIAKSIDGGASWQVMNNGLLDEFGGAAGVRDIAVDPANSQRVFVAANCDGVFLSEDGAGSWSKVYELGCEIDIDIDPANPLRVVSSSGVSLDGGMTWVNSTPDGFGRAPAVAIRPGSTTDLVAGVESTGAFRSTDNGTTWVVSRDNLGAGSAQDVIFMTADIGFVAADQTGIYRSDNGGLSWTATPSPQDIDYYELVFAPSDSSVGYAGTDDGVARTTDGGLTWQPANTAIAGLDIVGLAVDHSDPMRVFAASSSFNAGEVWLTADGGDNWSPTNVPISVGAEVFSVAVDPTNGDVIYAGVRDPSPPNTMVYKSTDGGGAWQVTDGAIDAGGAGVPALAVDPSDPNRVYAGTFADGLFRSDNGGQAWVPVTSLDGNRVTDIAVDPANPSRLFVRGQLSVDRGVSWVSVGPNFPFGRASTFVPGDGNTLYNANEMVGVFERRLLESRAEIPQTGVNASDRFGTQVVVRGEFIYVGLPGSDEFAPDAGAVIVYQRDQDNNLMEVQRFSAPAGRAASNFGAALAVEGDLMVVGAPQMSGQGGKGLAALQAAIFERIQGDWRIKAELQPTGGSADDEFGASIDLSGDQVIVGAPNDSMSMNGAGAAYVYGLDAGNVMDTQRIEPPTPTPGARFGQAVSVSQNRFAIGAPGSPLNNALSGSVALFERIADNLQSAGLAAPDTQNTGNEFGSAVDLQGDTLWVGAPGDLDDEGRVYQFDVTASMTQMAELSAAAPVPASRFGASLDASGRVLVVGSPAQPTVDGRNGTAFVFATDSAQNRLIEPVVPSDAFFEFGSSVRVQGENLVIGAPGSNNDTGAALFLSKPELVLGTGFELP